MICGFVNDQRNASLTRSTPLRKSVDSHLHKSGLGKLQPVGSILCSPRGSHM